jgi:hypothetical protein
VRVVVSGSTHMGTKNSLFLEKRKDAAALLSLLSRGSVLAAPPGITVSGLGAASLLSRGSSSAAPPAVGASGVQWPPN